MSNDRFTLDPSPEAGWWVVADNQSGLVCSFREHAFNDTQRFVSSPGMPADPLALAKAAREMGDWLREKHYDKIY